ncbi:MAG TPA: PIN domain-containing protein [Thermoanaerobaculia bacterium]|nr:PIN domain-containing protein [Thermoanaerobaculia bacterium]
MAAEAYLLDASALFTLVEDEPGAERVQEIIAGERALVPWIALLETHYVTRQERGAAEADRRYALLCEVSAEILWEIDEVVLRTASRLKAEHPVSLADAITGAYAHRHGAVLVHKDPEYENLRDLVALERLPAK